MRKILSGPATISLIVTSVLVLIAVPNTRAWFILEIEIHNVQLTHRLCTTQMQCDLQVIYNLLSQTGTKQKVEFTLENVTQWDEGRQVRRGDIRLKHKQTFRRKFLSNVEFFFLMLPTWLVANQDWNQITLQTTLRLTAPGRQHSPMNIQTSLSQMLALAPHEIVAPFHELRLTGSGVDEFGDTKPYHVHFDEHSVVMGFAHFFADFLFTYGATVRKDSMEVNVKILALFRWAFKLSIFGAISRMYTVVKLGWTGLLCEQRDPCSQPELVICHNDAECHPIYTPGQADGETAAFRCICQPGWTGPLCNRPELEYCRNEDRSYGTFRKADFNWLDDELHVALVKGRFIRFIEMTLRNYFFANCANTELQRSKRLE
ncbi:uncharacterized protein DEA37_0010529 [Paragonimus westermani]|uniref:EGF-like domain-containing protein n=1 Tax=Paragonimus westermani TaxID=34504 RepID=A0A5J4NHQ3_9TREM|nr:uncharacterized protein DEA37_0010529 [Paragonimus westermani]